MFNIIYIRFNNFNFIIDDAMIILLHGNLIIK